MEDVLASIRRILSEEGQQPAPTIPAPVDKSDGVLVLDASMMVVDERAEASAEVLSQPRTEPGPETPPSMVAPEAAASAATTTGNLLHTVTTDPSLKVRPGGATIEDIVRDELRLLLKNWLDAHLRETVERLVRAEIESVVGRSVP
jgi:cell pole-organizing protein PopZ